VIIRLHQPSVMAKRPELFLPIQDIGRKGHNQSRSTPKARHRNLAPRRNVESDIGQMKGRVNGLPPPCHMRYEAP
jgi:hypothetical protein